jgi:predicted kinase
LTVTRDDIREEIDAVWPRDEKKVVAIRNQRIADAISNGSTVVSADTNLSPKVRSDLRNLALAREARVSYHVFDTPLALCLARNTARERVVPERAIMDMYEKFVLTGDYLSRTTGAIFHD